MAAQDAENGKFRRIAVGKGVSADEITRRMNEKESGHSQRSHKTRAEILGNSRSFSTGAQYVAGCK